MSNVKISRKDLYYTHEHDWIDFQGAVAYAGVSQFKLTGFKEVQGCRIHHSSGFAQQGTVIATIIYNDYTIEARLPVDGSVIEWNPAIKNGHYQLLTDDPENKGWLIKLSPAQPYERKGLTISRDYQMNGKNKHAKS